tara:strand:+ start:403 stop:1311 length:909 start_codon:yes stop_codon:yes gene_type:complete
MVKFFNQKEEVLQINLTPYGKELFSSGSFMPAYYAFYDTGILYDGAYANVTEIQNNIVDRIKDNTPRLNRNTRFYSTNQPQVSLRTLDQQNIFYQTSSYNEPFYQFLGSNSPWSDYAPSWFITVTPEAEANFNDGIQYQMNGTLPMRSSSLDIEYKTSPEEEHTFYSLERNEKLVLDVQELNTLFKVNGNFDVEVLKVVGSGSSERYRSLGFINREGPNATFLTDQTTPHNLSRLINGTDEAITENFPILDNTYVEYYLDIAIDREISEYNLPLNSTLYTRDVSNASRNVCATITRDGRDNS